MNTHKKIYTLTLSAILIAVGTVIPLFMPKVIVGPMSFTLASHVAVMLALFISPSVAAAVALGTTLGFLIAGFPFCLGSCRIFVCTKTSRNFSITCKINSL